MKAYRTIVVGLGAMGSATLHHLAKRGHRVARHRSPSPPQRRLVARRHADHAARDRRRRALHAARDALAWAMARARARHRTTLLTQPAACSFRAVLTLRCCTSPGFFANTIAAAREYGIAHEVSTPARSGGASRSSRSPTTNTDTSSRKPDSCGPRPASARISIGGAPRRRNPSRRDGRIDRPFRERRHGRDRPRPLRGRSAGTGRRILASDARRRRRSHGTSRSIVSASTGSRSRAIRRRFLPAELSGLHLGIAGRGATASTDFPRSMDRKGA